ncbi:replication-relaxation family protein [Amycolatopsis sp. NPDC051716]|uniref:replication-relaxation family protein n=1 Tax=Amycolatopsis sp. NPDC051716 TaxID=3155804 RepID=UPI003412E9F5
MSGGSRPARVRQAHLDWLAERLSPRDQAILLDLGRVRLLTSSQLERIHFVELSGRSRAVVRARVLKRLVDWRVIVSLPRRVGGLAGGGSSEAVFALDSAGQRLYRQWAAETMPERVRRPSLPSERFVSHVLTVAELYVQAVEASRAGMLTLDHFAAEPDAWVHDGLGGWLKPDAVLVVHSAAAEDSWWIEVDKATEHVPTLRRKLSVYLDFVRRGQLGPGGVVPRVLLTVPSAVRLDALRDVIAHLPEPASKLFVPVLEERAIPTVAEVLLE